MDDGKTGKTKIEKNNGYKMQSSSVFFILK